jgi:putative transposase
MRRLDQWHVDRPFYGSRKLLVALRAEGLSVNHKRVERLLRLMGVEAIYPRPRPDLSAPSYGKYPYLLNDLEINGPDQVWCSDITYVPMANGFMYLVAVMDWWSRYVLAWRLSNSLDAHFCVETWKAALRHGRQTPLICNTDQGVQFTSPDFIDAVESAGVSVSQDGRGRWMDNRFIERLWRSVKYEDIYLHDYRDGWEAGKGLGKWFPFYNRQRPHQTLGNATPHDVYHNPWGFNGRERSWEAMRPKASARGGGESAPDPEGGVDIEWEKD